MAIYPIPFDILPSNYSFGKILLDIQIDHPTKSYQFVYRAEDRLGHVIRDDDPVSAYIGSYNSVGFRSTISQFNSQWDIDVLLGETMTYDDYCQQDQILRNDTPLTVLLDTKYNSKPVWSYNSSSGTRKDFCISSGPVPGVNHDDDITIIPSMSAGHKYLANHYRVELRVDGTYQYPDPDPDPDPEKYDVYLLKTEDNGLFLSDPPVSEAQATSKGYTISEGKAFIFF